MYLVSAQKKLMSSASRKIHLRIRIHNLNKRTLPEPPSFTTARIPAAMTQNCNASEHRKTQMRMATGALGEPGMKKYNFVGWWGGPTMPENSQYRAIKEPKQSEHIGPKENSKYIPRKNAEQIEMDPTTIAEKNQHKNPNAFGKQRQKNKIENTLHQQRPKKSQVCSIEIKTKQFARQSGGAWCPSRKP